MMKAPQWSQRLDKEFEKKKYSMLLNYASQSSINLHEKKNMSTTFNPSGKIFDEYAYRKDSTQRASELELHNDELENDSDCVPLSEKIFDFS